MSHLRLIKDKLSHGVMIALVVGTFLFIGAMGVGLYLRSAPLLQEYSLWEILSSNEWKPSKGHFGFLPFLMGTLQVTLIALVIALPLAFFTAIFLSEYAHPRVRRYVFPTLDILSAIPSVIYGMWGVLVIVPFISNKLAPHFVDYSSGYTLLAAGIVLGVMILPLLVSLLVEIFASVPNNMREASMALGATNWQTTRRVVVKKSLSGIFAAVVLAVSKAMGETIAVLMVCGNMPKIATSLFDACYPIPALLANNYGEMMSIPMYESAMMFSALMLFVIVVLFNLLSRIIMHRVKDRGAE